MKAQKKPRFDSTSLAVAVAFWVGIGGLGVKTEAAAVNLLEKYPTTLTAGDTNSSQARAWEFSPSDIFHLTEFSFQVGSGFRVKVGPADLGIGHGADGAVWAVVIPRAGGTLTSTATNQPESIAHVWLRFHPKIIGQLFPTATVLDDGNQRLAAQMSVIEGVKFRSSWHAGNNAMIPEPKDLTVDMDTVGGPRRFFAVDTTAQTAQYYADFEQRSVPAAPAITQDLAAATFDQLWQAFDKDYAMFVLRPEVDWAALSAQYRPLALASQTTYEFAGICAELLKPLRDLHVWLTVSDAYVPVYDRTRLYNANPNAYAPLLGSLHQSSSALQWAVTSDKVGFIVINNWTDTSLPTQFDEALESMRNTRGLIVDVRLNGGGSEPLAQQVAARFLEKVATYAFSQYRNGPQHTNLTAKVARTLAPRGPFRYDRPVVLLIGQRCMSSNESFISMMTCASQVVTMGDRTAGSSGNPKTVTLPLNMVVSVPQWIDYLADGTPLDERGIVPQVPFTASADAFQGERDDLLSAALERLKGVALPEEPIASQGLVLQGQWPGYRRNSANAVALSGNYAFVAAGGLQVIDITNPSNPQRVGGYDTDQDAEDIAVSGQRAYAIDSQSLYVLDVSDPTTPHRLGICDVGGWGKAVAVSGNYAYVASFGLYVIDIANPAQPRLAGKYATSRVEYDVAVSGNFAYLADGQSGLQVIDISNPAKPQLAGHYSPTGQVETVTVAGNYAYVGGYEVGFQVVEISDPAHPRLAGRYAMSRPPADITVSGALAYVASDADGLAVIDLTDPAQPKRIGKYDTPGSATGVAVSGNYAYVADEQAGLQVIDLSAPANPQWTGGFSTSGQIAHVAISGNYACAAEGSGGLRILDVRDPAHPRQVSTYAATGDTRSVATSGNYAFVVGSGGLDVVDLSDATRPQRVAQAAIASGGNDIVLWGGYAYVVGSQYLTVIDVADPIQPRQLGRCELSGTGAGLAVSGNCAVVAGGFSGLEVVDISNPAHPKKVGAYSSSFAYEVAAQGHYAYVAGQSGLAMVDLSDPAKPRTAGSFRSLWGFDGVAVSGTTAYVTGVEGLLVLDISNPARVRKLDQTSDVDRGYGVVLSGKMAYVLAGENGLMMIDRYQPPVRFASGMTLDLTGFHVIFRGEAGQTIRLQRSRDLKTWEDWVTLAGTGSSQEVVDPSAGSLSSQFYRLAPAVTAAPKFVILWYSSWNSWESIHMEGFFGYSEAAAIAEELGAANEEVEEDTRLTPEKLSAYDAVVFMNMETARTLAAYEQSAVRDFLSAGKSIVVIGQQDPGTALSQEAVFASSVTSPYGIQFTTGDAPDATTLADHPITQGLTSAPGGGSVLQVTPPAEALAPKGATQAVLAVSSYGPGRIVAVSDDSAFADLSTQDSESGRRFVSNILEWLLHLE